MRTYSASVFGIIIHLAAIVGMSLFALGEVVYGPQLLPDSLALQCLIPMFAGMMVLFFLIRFIGLLVYHVEIDGDNIQIRRRDLVKIRFRRDEIIEVAQADQVGTVAVLRYGTRTDVVEIPYLLNHRAELLEYLANGKRRGRIGYNDYTEMWLKRPSRSNPPQ